VRHAAWWRTAALLMILAATVGGDDSSAQTAGGDSPAAGDASVSPLLAHDHWAVRAARRLEAMGLAPGFLTAHAGASRGAVLEALLEADHRVEPGTPASYLVHAWVERFAEEFSEYAPRRGRSSVLLGSSVGVGFDHHEGTLVPARGAFHQRIDPEPVPAASRPLGSALLAGRPAGWASVLARPALVGSRFEVSEWEVRAGAGPIALSALRQPLAYGPVAGGGIVFGGNAAFARVQLETSRPIRLPGFLAAAGRTTFHTFATKLTEERHQGDPWFWGARVAAQPHRRLTIGVNRGAIFGGDHIETRVTLPNVARMLVGMLSVDFENQVVSADFRYRLPTESVVPLTAHLEWGAEDAAGAWWDVPGISAGLTIPALPGAPEVQLGVEYTTLAGFCCGNPPWYFHLMHPGNWVAGGAPLGHRLGGHGREFLLHGAADLAAAALRTEIRAFVRDRPVDGFDTSVRAGNLFGPPRFGSSHGGDVAASVRVSPRLELHLDAGYEAGRGWAERRASASANLLF
jgi:hypothetical protein